MGVVFGLVVFIVGKVKVVNMGINIRVLRFVKNIRFTGSKCRFFEFGFFYL